MADPPSPAPGSWAYALRSMRHHPGRAALRLLWWSAAGAAFGTILFLPLAYLHGWAGTALLDSAHRVLMAACAAGGAVSAVGACREPTWWA